MLFMNQNRIYGRVFRQEAGGDGDGDAGGAPNSGDGDGGNAGADDSAAKIAALQTQLDSVLAKNNELLGETKKAKAERTAAEKKAADDARAKAEAEGNFQQLYESSEQQREALSSQLADITQASQRDKINTTALKMASELAEGANVELLAEFMARRLKFADDGVKVTDESGNLTVSGLDDLKKEFAGSARFASLVKGIQSSGGGATGGSSGASGSKEMKRSEFDRLDPAAKSKFMKDGGKIIR